MPKAITDSYTGPKRFRIFRETSPWSEYKYKIEYEYDFWILICGYVPRAPYSSLLLTSWKEDYRNKIGMKCDNRKVVLALNLVLMLLAESEKIR